MRSASFVMLVALSLSASCESVSDSTEPDVTGTAEQALSLVPTPPWPVGDERGMGNTQGFGTRLRCAPHLLNPRSKEYELSHDRSPTMPNSPFATPLDYQYHPTGGLPFTKHAFNGEDICGEPAGQGTQMDALGHFAFLPNAWDPSSGPPPVQDAHYYGGFTQAQVKPTADSPLLKLGIEKAPPIITSAVLLDARRFINRGERLADGQRITAADINTMLHAEGLSGRGLLPGDVLYIYTGWEDLWQDPDVLGEYYTKDPGLSVDAALLMQQKAIVLIGLDTPFTDPVKEGQLQGLAPPPPDTPPGLPFFIHHNDLTQAGIHQIQNAHLAEMAADETWLSCTMILALKERGGAGSPVRPVAYGAPSH